MLNSRMDQATTLLLGDCLQGGRCAPVAAACLEEDKLDSFHARFSYYAMAIGANSSRHKCFLWVSRLVTTMT